MTARHDLMVKDPKGNILHDVSYRAVQDTRRRATTTGRIVDGVLTTAPFDLTVWKVRYTGAQIPTTIQSARLKLTFQPDGSAKGTLVGYENWQDIYRLLVHTGANDELPLFFTCPGVYRAFQRLRRRRQGGSENRTMPRGFGLLVRYRGHPRASSFRPRPRIRRSRPAARRLQLAPRLGAARIAGNQRTLFLRTMTIADTYASPDGTRICIARDSRCDRRGCGKTGCQAARRRALRLRSCKTTRTRNSSSFSDITVQRTPAPTLLADTTGVRLEGYDSGDRVCHHAGG